MLLSLCRFKGSVIFPGSFFRCGKTPWGMLAATQKSAVLKAALAWSKHTAAQRFNTLSFPCHPQLVSAMLAVVHRKVEHPG